jgi:hypothetical protein
MTPLTQRFPRFLLFAGLLTIAACGKGDPSSQSSTISNPTSATNGEVVFRFDVDDWLAEWRRDKKTAAEKYQGKVVELKGEVKWATVQGEGIDGGPGGRLILLGLDGEIATCITTDSQPWLTATTGSTVVVRGRGSRHCGDRLEDCVIVTAGLNPLIVITAEELSNSVQADPLEAAEKYNEKFVLVTGIVVEMKPAKFGSKNLVLRGTHGKDVTAYVGSVSAQYFKTIAKGDKITVYCQVQDVNDPKDGISLHMTQLTITPKEKNQ